MPIKTCKICGQEFATRHASKRTCSAECFRESERIYSRAHAATFSHERRRAYILVQGALSRGDLIRRPCEVCGLGRRIHAHHDDYTQPLVVRWLCTQHHKQHHAKHGPGLNAFRKDISA
jgi:hypothetical protein